MGPIRKIWQGIGRLLLFGLCFVVASTIGWGLAQISLRGLSGYLLRATWGLCWSGIAALPLALVFMLATRKRSKRILPLTLAACSWGLFLFVATTALGHYPPQPNFRFLPASSYVFSSNPGVWGYLQDDYTFRASSVTTIASAREELAAMGLRPYPDERRAVGEFRSPEIPDKILPNLTVYFSPGRITGKHFAYDGDFVDASDEKDWVTVSVTYPDPLPDWLRPFVR